MKRPKNFRGNTEHASTPARGGSVTRRYTRGNLSAARAIHKRRRHGAVGSSNGLGMRPPGSGLVNYQDPAGKHTPRLYDGGTTVGPETATHAVTDDTPPSMFVSPAVTP